MESVKQVFFGSQTSGPSDAFYTGKSDFQYLDIVLSTSDAAAVCSFTVQSTSEPSTSWATDVSALVLSTLPTGITYSNGVLSVASPAAGSYRVRLMLQTGPYIRVNYTYTSGGVSSTRVTVWAHDYD